MPVILVVDDEAAVCEMVRAVLALDGHRVHTAADGAAALDLLGSLDVDLVVLDVMMPGTDGFSVLSAIKSGRPAAPSVPVIMLTARADDVDRLRGGLEGAVRYITKPFSPGELRDAVREVLAGGPEPAQRHAAARAALTELARRESGRRRSGDPAPRLTRYEHRAAPAPAPHLGALTDRQRELVEAVLGHPDVAAAAGALGLSRRGVYAALERAARRAGLRSGPDLLVALRASRGR